MKAANPQLLRHGPLTFRNDATEMVMEPIDLMYSGFRIQLVSFLYVSSPVLVLRLGTSSWSGCLVLCSWWFGDRWLHRAVPTADEGWFRSSTTSFLRKPKQTYVLFHWSWGALQVLCASFRLRLGPHGL